MIFTVRSKHRIPLGMDGSTSVYRTEEIAEQIAEELNCRETPAIAGWFDDDKWYVLPLDYSPEVIQWDENGCGSFSAKKAFPFSLRRKKS